MTGFDILVLIVVGISALLAFARGFVREFLSMIALVLAVLAAIWGLPVFGEAVRGMVQPNWIANTVTVVSLFLLVYVAVRVLTGRIHEWIHDSEPLGILDRSAGILFGVARGFILVATVILGLTSVVKTEKLPKTISDAQFYPFLVITADALKNFAPNATKAATDAAKDAAIAGEGAAQWQKDNEALIEAGKVLAKSQLKSKTSEDKNAETKTDDVPDFKPKEKAKPIIIEREK